MHSRLLASQRPTPGLARSLLLLRDAATMSQSVALKCLDRYGFPLAGLTAAEQAVRTEAAARETKLQEKWSRQVGSFANILQLAASTFESCFKFSICSVLLCCK